MNKKPYSGITKDFNYKNQKIPIKFIETSQVKKGVYCDVYKFTQKENSDLGIISIKKGASTPKQKILSGEKTIEGYISGHGFLIIKDSTGEENRYKVNSQTPNFKITVKIGETMQWHADKDSELSVYEICYPPYQEGRFKNLPD